MKRIIRVAPIMIALFFMHSCSEDPIDVGQDTGTLNLSVDLLIEELPASGRVREVVDIENYKVTIFNADGTEAIVFDPWSSAPAPIELVTGEYYIEAHSNNLVDAEFDNPYYFGRSENFTIDKEEIKDISVECSLANYKVSVIYSDNIKTDFDTYGMTVTYLNSSQVLDYGESEELEGYFRANNPIFAEISLVYNKVFDGTTIERTLVASIPDPQPRTHYRINADAMLDNGHIVISLEIDDGVEIIDIDAELVPVLNGPVGPDVIGAIWTPGGNPDGFAFGEVIWAYENIDLADHDAMYWGPVIGAMKASMDGDTFDDTNLNEILDFVPDESDLANGILIWMGSTQIPLHDGTFLPANTRLEMSIFDGDGVTPRALVDPADTGMPASIGGLVPISGSSDSFEVHFELLSSLTEDNWTFFLQIFDEAATPPDAGGTAHSSFSGGFYWED